MLAVDANAICLCPLDFAERTNPFYVSELLMLTLGR